MASTPDVIIDPRGPPLVYGGRYSEEGELGTGGMGRVVRARDLKLDRFVALKVLRPGLHDAKQLQRFAQEARAAGALNHPNIVTVFDAGEHDNEPYIVQELLQGATLRAILRKGPLTCERAAELALQFAHGLSAAHQHGIVHRDLKPENLFVTDDGRLKILDFGIAKLLGTDTPAVTTDTGAVVGSVGYMSPEQLRAQRVDHRSDIFTFGVILHEMLSGKAPFAHATAVEIGY